MLDKLSRSQVEQALQCLQNPSHLPLPKELQELSQVEWFLLSRMLEYLLEEKDSQPLQ